MGEDPTLAADRVGHPWCLSAPPLGLLDAAAIRLAVLEPHPLALLGRSGRLLHRLFDSKIDF